MHIAMRASTGCFGIVFGTMDPISNALVEEDRWFVGKDSSCVLHLRILSLWKDDYIEARASCMYHIEEFMYDF